MPEIVRRRRPAQTARQAVSNLAHGGDEFGPGDLDRRVPNPIGGIPRGLALDVDDRGRQLWRKMTRDGARVLFLPLIPTMAVATGYDLLKSLTGKGDNPIGVRD